MLLFLLVLALGTAALYFGGDKLVDGMQGIGRAFSFSPMVTGLLLVSFGTSAPELFVSAGAALQGFGGIAAGNAIGSNIANLAIVLGLGAAIAVLPVARDIARRQIPVMCAITVLAVLLMIDGVVTRLDGAMLLAACVGGLWWAAQGSSLPGLEEVEGAPVPGDGTGAEAADDAPPSNAASAFAALLGIGLLLVGAEALIWSGTGIASTFGVPDAVIALTITAIGTSLPEIAATVVAVRRAEVDLAIGNVVGSNIMNLGLVLGAAGVLTPIDAAGLGTVTWVWLIALSALLALLAFKPGRVTRPVGFLLLGSYVVYVLVLMNS